MEIPSGRGVRSANQSGFAILIRRLDRWGVSLYFDYELNATNGKIDQRMSHYPLLDAALYG